VELPTHQRAAIIPQAGQVAQCLCAGAAERGVGESTARMLWGGKEGEAHGPEGRARSMA